jgi:phosphatidylinositol glycan class C protein
MADATVIVQHIASVAIFCCCFVGIVQDRVSPVTVVSWATFCTVVGWGLWDYWVGKEETKEAKTGKTEHAVGEETSAANASDPQGLGLTMFAPDNQPPQHPLSETASSNVTNISTNTSPGPAVGPESLGPPGHQPTYIDPTSSLSPRNQQRLETAKSALLIYAALLGLSPILKSLTKSTTSDSIWALSTWLLCMNVAFFDYGGETGAQ